MRASGILLYLAFLAIMAGCGSPARVAVDPAPSPSAADQALPPIRFGTLGAGLAAGSAVQFRGAPDASLRASLETAGGERRISISVKGEVTDVYISVAGESGRGIDWRFPSPDDYLSFAISSSNSLELALVGLGTGSPAPSAETVNRRHTLPREFTLCRLLEPSSIGSETILRQPSAYPAFTPAGLAIGRLDGKYRLTWPATLPGDYDNNGSVTLADVTPLGMLLRLKRPADGVWPLAAHARVDGNGDGEINASDLQRIGANYRRSFGTYRVERNSGDASAPGAEWDEVAAELPRSALTKYGSPVTTLGADASQQLLQDPVPGWAWYRVVYVEPDGTESAPSEPMLSPDLVAPSWPSGDQTALVPPDPPARYTHQATFADASDDRGGAITYEVAVRSGTAEPFGSATTAQMRYPENSATAVTSPYDFAEYRDANQNAGFNFGWDIQYYVAVFAQDAAGNAVQGTIVPFMQTDDGIPDAFVRWGDQPGFAQTFLKLMVSRTGQVKADPGPLVGNATETQCFYYYKVEPVQTPWNLDSYNDPADYNQSTKTAFDGGPFDFPLLLKKGEKVTILVEAGDAATGPGMTLHNSIARPDLWLEPFEPPTVYGFAPLFRYASDGTPMVGANDHDVLFLTGSAFTLEPVGSAAPDTFDQYLQSILRIPETGELLFMRPEGLVNRLLWWQQRGGMTGLVEIPRSVLPNGFYDRDNVPEWQLDSPDTVIGLRYLPQPVPGGGIGLELWEAHRSGNYGVREMLTPPTLNENERGRWVRQVADSLVLGVVTPGGFFGVDQLRLAVRDPEGNWTEHPYNDWPPEFDSARWQRAALDDQRAVDATTTHVIIRAYDLSEDPSLPYIGLYEGDLRQGLHTFVKRWAYEGDKPLTDPAYPGWSVRVNPGAAAGINYFHPAFGHRVCGAATKSTGEFGYAFIDADGRFAELIPVPEFAAHSFTDVNFYFSGSQEVPGLACGQISADGQWMWRHPLASQEQPTFGRAVKLP